MVPLSNPEVPPLLQVLRLRTKLCNTLAATCVGTNSFTESNAQKLWLLRDISAIMSYSDPNGTPSTLQLIPYILHP